MRVAPAVFVLLLAAPALAQDPVPDTTGAWRYFPLAIGNVWEYYEESGGGFGPPCFPEVCTYVTIEEVVEDTLFGGDVYFVLQKTTYQTAPEPLPPPNTSRDYVRFDTLEATVVEYPSGQEFNGGCRLDEAFPANPDEPREIECEASAAGRVYGGYAQQLVFGADTLVTALKGFGYFTGVVVGTSFAADVGLLYYHAEEFGYSTRYLTYARVGGIEYGEPSGVAVEPAAPSQGTLALRVYPNPSGGLATLDLAVPTPQRVTVEAFDALGRRVYAEERWVAGPMHLAIDGGAWAPGAYVVRVMGEDGHPTSARLVKM